jgi:hypothetical protein
VQSPEEKPSGTHVSPWEQGEGTPFRRRLEMAGDTVLVDPGNDDPAINAKRSAASSSARWSSQTTRTLRRFRSRRSRTITTGSNRKVGSKTTPAQSPRFLGAAPRPSADPRRIAADRRSRLLPARASACRSGTDCPLRASSSPGGRGQRPTLLLATPSNVTATLPPVSWPVLSEVIPKPCPIGVRRRRRRSWDLP